MVILYDDEGNSLSPEQVMALSRTDEGRKRVKGYLLKARVGMATQEVLNYLGHELKLFSRSLSPEEQQNLCNIVWYVLFNAPQDQVFEWVNEVSQCPQCDPDLYGAAGNC